MTGCVFSIQPFCVDDGPGVRTCVYLKGCNMRCKWCHNPESLTLLPEISYIESKCEHCGKCAAICSAHTMENGRHHFYRGSVDESNVNAANQCPTGALSVVGNAMTADEVLAKIARDKRYFDRSGGGLTVTGGEPMMQPAFLRELLSLARAEGIHTCIETNGASKWDDYLKILGDTDLLLVDYKLTDDALHKEMTGISNNEIRGNIQHMLDHGANVVLRCPIIPGLNDTADHFSAIAEITSDPRILGFEIMPYHSFGVSKASRLGQVPQVEFDIPDKQKTEGWKDAIRSMGGREWRRGL